MKSLLSFKNHSSYFDDNKCFVRYNNKSIELIGYDEKIMISLRDNLLPVVEFIDFHHYDGETLCKIYCKYTDEKINIPVFNHWSEVYKKTDTDFINGERVYRYEDDNEQAATENRNITRLLMESPSLYVQIIDNIPRMQSPTDCLQNRFAILVAC